MALNMKAIEQRLAAKRSELEQSLTDLTEAHPTPVDPNEASQGPQDFEETAVDFLETQQEQSIQVNQQSLLTEVQRAQQRIKDGTYGTCQRCGKPIPEKRLEAIPWAAYDIECQTIIEQENLSHEDAYDNSETI